MESVQVENVSDPHKLAVEDQKVEEIKVPTSNGVIHVTVVGDRSMPAIFTYHDVGLTPTTCFGPFMQTKRAAELSRYFCWYHVTAPGNEPFAEPWQGEYLTMDQLALNLVEVITYFNFSSSVILFGVGAGANVVTRLAMHHEQLVHGLILVALRSGTASMFEKSSQLYGKLESFIWKSAEVEVAAQRLLNRFFSKETAQDEHELIIRYRNILNHMTPNQLKYVLAYEARTEITKDLHKVKANIISFIGDLAGDAERQDDNCREFHSGTSSILKIESCADLITVEDPFALLQPMQLFFVSIGSSTKHIMSIDFGIDKE